ncbi:MAG: hypothetical protein AAGE59_30485, partial [Cyanobacteria bacterium P01_F01_bin.86]
PLVRGGRENVTVLEIQQLVPNGQLVRGGWETWLYLRFSHLCLMDSAKDRAMLRSPLHASQQRCS